MSLTKVLLKRIARNLILALVLIQGYELFFSNKNIDPAFDSIYLSFLKESKDRFIPLDSIKITIKFSDTLSSRNQSINSDGEAVTTLATCFNVIGFQPTITVDFSNWTRMNEIEKEMVLYHELAHCLLYKGHTDDKDSHAMYVSLMHDTKFSTEIYLLNRDKYLTELFSYKPYHFRDMAITFLNPLTIWKFSLRKFQEYWTKTVEYQQQLIAYFKAK